MSRSTTKVFAHPIFSMTACLGVSLAAAPLTRADRLTPDLPVAFDAYLESALVRYDVPGAAVAVVEGGRTVYAKALGKRARHGHAPVDKHTLFMIGSVTKSMTSMMMAIEVERGALDWNAPVTQFLPTFALSNPQSTQQIRVRDLVNHSSGVPRYDVPLMMENSRPKRMIASLSEIPIVAPPGQSYNYSNQMYATGGYVAALTAGAKYDNASLEAGYAALMHERVFGPIGMERTTLDIDEALRSPNHALPHTWDPVAADVAEVPPSFEHFATPIAPAGAVWSNIEDMARYAITQMGGVAPSGQRVVSAAALQPTQTTEIQIQPGVGYGMGWGVVEDLQGQRVLTHDGGTAGFASLILLVPDAQFGIVILANNADGGSSFHSAVANYFYQAAFGLPHQGEDAIYQAYQADHAALAEIEAGSPPVTWAETRSYVGAYTHDLCAVYDPRWRGPGFTLQTDFGVLPLLSLAQFGQPGLYATSRNWVGVVAQFTDDSIILGTGDGDATNWTVDRIVPTHPRPGVHPWRWREHVRRPAVPHPFRWSERP
jgi:CubicO group peptidase (beta-lactamase class C family)